MNMSMFYTCIPLFLHFSAFTGVFYSSPFCYKSSFTLPNITHHAYGHTAHLQSHYGTCSSLLSTFLVFSFTFSQAPLLIMRHGFLANPSTCTSHMSHLQSHRRLTSLYSIYIHQLSSLLVFCLTFSQACYFIMGHILPENPGTCTSQVSCLQSSGALAALLLP